MIKPQLIVIRFGEFLLKGRNRNKFQNKILNEIKQKCMLFPNLIYGSEFGRLYIELHGHIAEDVMEAVSTVFGIESYSPACTASLDIDFIASVALEMMENKQGRTFKVDVRRADKTIEMDSMHVTRQIGGAILRQYDHLRVDVHHPDITLRVELRKQYILVMTDVIQGAGGYPLGTNGKAALMLSGGIDSPVAGFMAMRRGIEIHAVHFHSYPYTSERAKQKVIDLAKRLSHFSGKMQLHLVHFTDIQTYIYEHYQDNLLVTLLRRAMFRITEGIAKQKQLSAIVTGESVGQVASQTLSSMHAVHHAVHMPILQPLVTMDKKEIIRQAEKIGTYETSILPYEDCCTIFLPPSPSTNPNLRVIHAIESKLTELDAKIEQAIEQIETIEIHPSYVETNEQFF